MNNLKNNKFLVLFIGLIAFFILVFFTKNYYLEMTQNVLENETNIEKLESLNTKLDELNKLKKDLNDKNKEVTKTLKKFMGDFKEDKLLFYINNYVEQINNSAGGIVLSLENISFSDFTKTELGFKRININLKMNVSNKYILKNLLDYLVSSDNEYGFFITDFSFDIEKPGPYKINIPLHMYVK